SPQRSEDTRASRRVACSQAGRRSRAIAAPPPSAAGSYPARPPACVATTPRPAGSRLSGFVPGSPRRPARKDSPWGAACANPKVGAACECPESPIRPACVKCLRTRHARFAICSQGEEFLMRWSLFLVTAALCAAAELQVPPDVIVERGLDYT